MVGKIKIWEYGSKEFKTFVKGKSFINQWETGDLRYAEQYYSDLVRNGHKPWMVRINNYPTKKEVMYAVQWQER